MKRVALLLLLSSTALTPAVAQIAQTDQAAQSGSADGTAVEDFARKVNIVTKARRLTAIPENEPLAIDLGLVEVPGVPRGLTEGVTAKGYARHVVVDGELIGQVVMTGVEKDGRQEPLDSRDFVGQFELERPELDPSTPVTVEGDEEELKAALERLTAPAGDDEEKEKEPEQERADTSGATGKVGSNAGENADAAGYQTPEPLETKESTPPTVRVTTEGCEIRVDLDQMQAIQQSRVETTEDGNVTLGNCEDGDQRYPIKRSYAACGDAVDLEGRTATAQYLLYYTDGGGTRNEVSECQPDQEQVFQIIEQRDACTVQLDYTELQAVPRAALVYTNATNTEVQVRGCEPSEDVDPVPLVPVTDGCSIRHDFDAGTSFQQGRHIYELDGITWQAGACADNGVEYPHEKIYETATGAPVCPPVIDEEGGTITLQSRLRITVDGVEQYITECKPDSSALALVATTEGCENPATWTHDISAGVSYGRERYYYTRNGEREYITDCQDSTATYPHQVETTGWQNHDDQLFAYRLTTVYIKTPQGRYNIKTSEVLPGSEQTPYVYDGETEVANGERWYEEQGCTRWEGRDLVQSYTRPDGSTYERVIGEAEPVNAGNACTVDRPDTPSDWSLVGFVDAWLLAQTKYKDCCEGPDDNFFWVYTSTVGNRCEFEATRTITREDGELISQNTKRRLSDIDQNYKYTKSGARVNCGYGYKYNCTPISKIDDEITKYPGMNRKCVAASGSDVQRWLGELGW